MASDCTLPDVCRLVHGGVKDPFFYADPYPRPALKNINFFSLEIFLIYEKFDLVHFLV